MIIGLSAGRDSSAGLRARIALDEAGQRALLRSRRPGIAELVVLSTCHRTEIYATADGADVDIVHEVAALLPALQPTDQHDLRTMHGSEVVEHLFRVASGLDSLVVGEPQVLGQVRRALALAQQEGAAGPLMTNVFGRAIKVGRRVRSETALGSLGMSIGTIATQHLSARFTSLQGRMGAVVGGGEAATDAALALSAAGARLSVVNRTAASGQRLAAMIGASAHPLDEMPAVFSKSDFAVVAVSGGVLVTREHLPVRDEAAPFVVLDLSVPRSVDVTPLLGVEVRAFEELPGPRGAAVTDAVIDAEALVRKEVADLQRWIDTRASGPVIRDLRARGESIAREEIARAISGMRLSPEEAEKIAALGMRIANKLLHEPSAALRSADEETVRLVRQIFRLPPQEGR